jgi:hypothetical protein
MGDDLLGILQREGHLVRVLLRRDDAHRQRMVALRRGGHLAADRGKGPTIMASR